MLSGRRSLVRGRAVGAGEVIELVARRAAVARPDRRRAQRDHHAGVHPAPRRADRQRPRRRRAGRLVPLRGARSGSREFLTRNGHPYASIDLDHDDGVQALLDRFNVQPAATCRCSSAAATPCCATRPTGRSPTAWASTTPSMPRKVRDVVIVGAGPSGLAAAVYARVGGARHAGGRDQRAGRTGRRQLEDRELPGIPDRHLRPGTGRPGVRQAQKFGAQIVIAKGARELACARKPYAVRIDDDVAIPARTVDHRHRRRLPPARRSRTWRSSRAPASTTARRTSRRSCAATARWW